MNSKFYILILFCLLFCFNSCRNKTTDSLLDEAGNYMDVRLDTANIILDKIPHPEKLKGLKQARYCRMKAICAGYVLAQWQMADSLNNISLDYSRQASDTARLANSLLFAARVDILYCRQKKH